MFVGSINQDLRSIINEMAPAWKDKKIFVGCSGNFTVERILAKASITDIHSNDVSLYSCAIGNYLTGQSMDVRIQDNEYRWLEKYLSTGLDLIATLLLCSEMLNYSDRPEPYHKRMFNAYLKRFSELHDKTVEKVKAALEGIKIKSFYAGDVLEFISGAPADCVAVSFPPTYASGYERLYKKIDQVFSWNKPEYQIFDDDSFNAFTRIITEKEFWVTLRDKPVEELSEYLRSMVKTGMHSKPVYVYAGEGKSRLTQPHQKTEAVYIKRMDGEIEGSLSLMKITQGQMNLLRSKYLSPAISPAGAQVNLGVLAGGKLIGAIAFSRSSIGWCDAYMMTDFAVDQTIYKKLAKLILAVALSKETHAILQQSFNSKVCTIGTTAFTNKAVSMKYRGIFDLHDRKDGRLNYIANAGVWTLEGGLQWWMKNHSQKSKNYSSS